MTDPTAMYRSSQVATASPLGQVVLLYEGAIRFSVQHLAHLERGDLESAHRTSLRAQAIVAQLRETLDLSAGDVAERLDTIYTYILGRLVTGNLTKAPEPTMTAITFLRDLAQAWRAIEDPVPPAKAEALRVLVPAQVAATAPVSLGLRGAA